jgi:hypothetical protein
MIDISMLKAWSEQLEKEIAAMDIADASLPEKKALLKSILSKCKTAVDDAPTSGSKLSGSDFSRDQLSRLRSSESALSELEFTGHDYDSTTKFVNKVDMIFDAFISDDRDLEPIFVKRVKLTFQDNPYSRLKAASTSPTTWDDLKSWITEYYNSGLVSVQLLQRALETDYKKNSCWKAFATDVDRRMDTAKKAVNAQLRKNKAATTGKTLDDPANAPDVNDIYSFFAASIVADRIKSHDQVVHSLMAQEWRTVNCAADVAAKAEFLVSQTGSSSTALFTRQSAGLLPSQAQSEEGPNKQSDKYKSRKWREPCPHGRQCRQGKLGKCDLYHGRNFGSTQDTETSSDVTAAKIAVLEAKIAALEDDQPTLLPIESSSMFI